MKSNKICGHIAWLHALVFLLSPCLAAEKPVCEVSVAVLGLPDGDDGLLHWRVANTVTTPLQLSTRYFSERLKLSGTVIQFHKQPVLAVSAQEPPPEPLVTLKIPEGQKLVYIVLSSELDKNQQIRWRGNMLDASDWSAGSMKVFNASSEPIGLTAGEKKIQLTQGKSVDFHIRDWAEAFPVKIFRLQPELKTIFSSSWRVAAGRRELCFIGDSNGSVTLRSLMDLAASPTDAAP